MQNNTYSKCITQNFLSDWNRVAKTQKPVIAAVNGYALGGGKIKLLKYRIARNFSVASKQCWEFLKCSFENNSQLRKK
jgi:1,4-dihydroxy-2-naphthoyl-CoA synthase